MPKKVSSDGFSLIETAVVLLVVALLGITGWFIWRHTHQYKEVPTTTNSITQKQNSPSSQQTQTADPYAGWKTYCDAALKACYKYPIEWVQAQYGGWQNATDTAYFDFGASNKDQAADNVYVAAIEDLANSNQNLKIVGTVNGNIPGYAIYDASVVSDKHLAVGQTTQLVTGNPTFSGRGADKDISFVATPGAAGIATIANPTQAKAWFNTPEAHQCLKTLQTFYYE